MNSSERAISNLFRAASGVPFGMLRDVAEFEREVIRTRTGEGRARAVANGVRLGRKPTLTHHQQREAIKRRAAGKETLVEIARSYGRRRIDAAKSAVGIRAGNCRGRNR